ncbi:hypothetical protein [Streptomyces nitrosporeus]|uniref:hypothetical protein n=1 Tax=Streptomyces nitrosporeus TaxID=28894 RepID=UPI0039A3B78B
MDRPTRPNEALRALIAEAGLTAGQLAAGVNRVSRESGAPLDHDRTTVAHWLAGTMPRRSSRPLITEALSRSLGRHVTALDAGFAEPSGTELQPRVPVQDPVEILRRVSEHDVNEQPVRERAAKPLYTPDDVVPALGGITAAESGCTEFRFDNGRAPIRKQDVQAAEALAQVFHESDITFGGGRARRALALYLAGDGAEKLRRPASPALRRGIVQAMAQLSYLCGFMHFDDGLHGMAQQYYRASLRLSIENNSALHYAVTLRAMSVQACSLHHVRQAVDLAEAATGTVAGPPVHRAFVQGQLAVAYALDRDPSRAMRAVAEAERLLHRSRGPVTSVTGRYHEGSLLRQESAVREFLGDDDGAVRALVSAARHRPEAERRSRAMVHADLAALQLKAGRLDEAADSGLRFLDEYPLLASGRANQALAELRAGMRPHARQPAARRFLRCATRATSKGPGAGSGKAVRGDVDRSR